ncbi:hypothetical protein HMPREF1579_01272 [Gardnerella vaginalis JCP8066]|nr:hypothetical protein HMPREF1579_01272 [Gardnerella vaginalis JCP8066]
MRLKTIALSDSLINNSARDDLPFRLERSAKRQFGALSLLKVESTVCFQRKRRRSRA